MTTPCCSAPSPTWPGCRLRGAGYPACAGCRRCRKDLRHGTVKGPRGIMFAWAVDGKGRFQLYDNPRQPQLLAFWFLLSRRPGFPEYRGWILSNNPHFTGTAPSPGRLSARPEALAAGRLQRYSRTQRRGGDFLLRAPMDNGFCCETVDPQTGRALPGRPASRPASWHMPSGGSTMQKFTEGAAIGY